MIWWSCSQLRPESNACKYCDKEYNNGKGYKYDVVGVDGGQDREDCKGGSILFLTESMGCVIIY